MPTVACASAGASLIAVARHRDQRVPRRCSCLDDRPLVRRAAPRRAHRRSRAAARPRPRSVRLSPVSITTVTPSALQRAESPRPPTAGSDRRPRSAPAGAPSTATNSTVCPSRRSSSARSASVAGVDAARSHQLARCRASTARPSTRPLTPWPVVDWKSATGRNRETPRVSRRADDRRGERMLAAALDRRGEPQQLVLGPRRRRRRSRSAAGRPSVSVPVLSTTSVSTRASSSSASAFLISTPGVRAAAGADHDGHRRRQAERARAGDDQHRHGVDQRVREARLRARRRPRRRTSSAATSDHRRHEVRRRPDRRAAESARACAAPRRPSARSARAACRCRRARAVITSVPLTVDRAADHAVARLLVDRDRLAGDHRFVDRAAPSSDDAVDRHLLAGPHAQQVADLDLVRAARPLRGRSRTTPRGLRREPEQLANRRAGAMARAQLEHLPEQHEHGDDDRGVEVGVDRAVHPEAVGKEARRHGRDHAVADTPRRRRGRSA